MGGQKVLDVEAKRNHEMRQAFIKQIDEKIDALPDMAKIAQRAKVSQSVAEEILGISPSHWRAFYHLICRSYSLSEFLDLGFNIYSSTKDKELWTTYATYLSSPWGHGVITPKDWIYEHDSRRLEVLNSCIDLRTNVLSHIDSLSMDQLYSAKAAVNPYTRKEDWPSFFEIIQEKIQALRINIENERRRLFEEQKQRVLDAAKALAEESHDRAKLSV